MSKSLERLREQWPLLVLWLFIAAAMFVYCMENDELDDLAGWIPVLVVVQLLALPVVGHPAVESPGRLSLGSSIAFGLALGLATGFAVFLFCAIAGFWIFHGDFELRPILLGMVFGSLAAIATAVRYSLVLRRRPHPQTARRGLLELILVCVFVVAAALLDKHGMGGVGFLIAVPFLWMAPLWLLFPRRPRAPRAIAL